MFGWLHGKKFLFCAGNHDFIDPDDFVSLLRRLGVDAHNITDRRVEHGPVSFYGFPWCPPITGEWNFEVQESDIRERLGKLPIVDVLVTHCPPYQVLDVDNCGFHRGSTAMNSWYSYAGNVPKKAWLFGHLHESGGIQVRDRTGVLFSNAATTQNLLEL
jgi:Icc-related predicted phosphoesterase